MHASIRVVHARTRRKSEIRGKIMGIFDRTDSRYNYSRRKMNILIRDIDFMRRNNKYSYEVEDLLLMLKKFSRRGSSTFFSPRLEWTLIWTWATILRYYIFIRLVSFDFHRWYSRTPRPIERRWHFPGCNFIFIWPLMQVDRPMSDR